MSPHIGLARPGDKRYYLSSCMRNIHRRHAPLPPHALRAFEAIARHLSFARAAEELHVTPAALSIRSAGWSRRSASALVPPGTRAIALTEAGKLIYPGIHAGFCQPAQRGRADRSARAATMSLSSARRRDWSPNG